MGAASLPHATPGCYVAAGKSSAGTYSSTGGRLGPGRGGSSSSRLAGIGACTGGGQLELVDPRLGSDNPLAPEDEEESTVVSFPTYVLKPIVVSKESDSEGTPAPLVSSDLSDMFDKN